MRGADFLARARPLVAELRALGRPVEDGELSSFSLALADSVASSWGPRVIGEALRKLTGLTLDLHAHRSVLLIESVRLGRYHVGLSTLPSAPSDLVEHPLFEEPMVLVFSGLSSRPDKRAPLISIEPNAMTWRAIEPLVARHQPALLTRPRTAVESFGAALQMVRAGFGDGLVPLGLAMEMRVPVKSYRRCARRGDGEILLENELRAVRERLRVDLVDQLLRPFRLFRRQPHQHRLERVALQM